MIKKRTLTLTIIILLLIQFLLVPLTSFAKPQSIDNYNAAEEIAKSLQDLLTLETNSTTDTLSSDTAPEQQNQNSNIQTTYLYAMPSNDQEMQNTPTISQSIEAASTYNFLDSTWYGFTREMDNDGFEPILWNYQTSIDGSGYPIYVGQDRDTTFGLWHSYFRGHLQFDTSTIPDNADILEVQLNFYVPSTFAAIPDTTFDSYTCGLEFYQMTYKSSDWGRGNPIGKVGNTIWEDAYNGNYYGYKYVTQSGQTYTQTLTGMATADLENNLPFNFFGVGLHENTEQGDGSGQNRCIYIAGGANCYLRVEYELPFDFSVSASPSSRSVTKGDSTTYSVTTTLTSGSTQTVSLSCSSLTGTSFSFVPSSSSPTFSSTLYVYTSASTPTGTHTLTITASGGGKTHTTTVQLSVNNPLTIFNDPRMTVTTIGPINVPLLTTMNTFSIYWVTKSETASNVEYRSAFNQYLGIDLVLEGFMDYPNTIGMIIEFQQTSILSYLNQNYDWAFSNSLFSNVENDYQSSDGSIRLVIPIGFSQLNPSILLDAGAVIIDIVKAIDNCAKDPLKFLDKLTVFTQDSIKLMEETFNIGLYIFKGQLTTAQEYSVRNLMNALSTAKSMLNILRSVYLAKEFIHYLRLFSTAVFWLRLGIDTIFIGPGTADLIIKLGSIGASLFVSLLEQIWTDPNWWQDLIIDSVRILARALDPPEKAIFTSIYDNSSGNLVLGYDHNSDTMVNASNMGFMLRSNSSQYFILNKGVSYEVNLTMVGEEITNLPYTISVTDEYMNMTYGTSGWLETTENVEFLVTIDETSTEITNYLIVTTNSSISSPSQGESVIINAFVTDDLENPITNAEVSLLVNNSTWIDCDELGNGYYQTELTTADLYGWVTVGVYADASNKTTGYTLEILHVLKTWTVDDDGIADFSSIQAAVNAAIPGDIIIVSDGFYSETVVVAKNNLTIQGTNALSTILNGSFHLTCNYSSISNFQINRMNLPSLLWEPAFFFQNASHNHIIHNVIMNSGTGITFDYVGGTPGFHSSSYNIIEANDFINCGDSVCFFYGFTNNTFFHNNFYSPKINIYFVLNEFWDSGYPSGGNYWSDYLGIDDYSGIYQNETGSDGIGDTPYIKESIEFEGYLIHDHYPLMTPWNWIPNRVQNLDTGLNYTTIQAAINAPETLDGHEIYVKNGTYFENIIMDKSLALIGENNEGALIYGGDDDNTTAITVFADNSSISNFKIRIGETIMYYPRFCIKLASDQNHIYGNNIEGWAVGIDAGSNNIIESNKIICYNGIYAGSNNSIIFNNVSSGIEGIQILGSNNLIRGNTISGNSPGLINGGDNNLYYHNNFIENDFNQVEIINSISQWNQTYPVGGNYWSDYSGDDFLSGPNQDQPGSDGIGDTPYVIDENNQDNYPLILPEEIPTTIYIRADGTVDPIHSPIKREDDQYILMDNIYCRIQIEKSNIILNGNGFNIVGGGLLLLGPEFIVEVTIMNFTIMECQTAIALEEADGITIKQNIIKDCQKAINLCYSSSTIFENSFINNQQGIFIMVAGVCNIYHNNFEDNYENIGYYRLPDLEYPTDFHLDNGYPDGGNYWSDYSGDDFFSGPNQDQVGSDGIIDVAFSPYVNSTDNYPFKEESGWLKTETVHNINTGLDYFSIQGAIDAPETLNNHIILVDAGTYFENVVVTKSVSIIGENASNTIINGGGENSAIEVYGVNNTQIHGFTIKNSDSYGVYLRESQNNSVSQNVIMDCDRAIYLLMLSNATISGNNITESNIGIFVSDYSVYNVVSENCVTNSSYGILLGECNNNTIAGNMLADNVRGIQSIYDDFNSILENTVVSNSYGVVLYGSSNNVVLENNITNSETYGIFVTYFSISNLISKNRLVSNHYGLQLYNSPANTVTENYLMYNNYGLEIFNDDLTDSNNLIFHNNFIDNNIKQVNVHNASSTIWDDGYPSGGNYWSDYSDVDIYSGPNQDESGSDGIWDNPYVIDSENQDRYPLVVPFSDSEVEWSISLNATLDTFDDVSVFGVANLATDGFDVDFDQVDPIPPPTGVVSYFYYPDNPTVPVNLQKLSTSKIGSGPIMNWTYKIMPVGVGGSLGLSWNQSEVDLVPEEYGVLLQLLNGSIVDMRGVDEFVFVAESDVTYVFSVLVSKVYVSSFEVLVDEENVSVNVATNSTILNFGYNQTSQEFSFDVSGFDGTGGVCNMTVPKTVGSAFVVYVDGEMIEFVQSENATHYFLYFSYTHSTHTVTVAVGVEFVLELGVGWNMVSFSAVPDDANFSSVFGGLGYYQVLTWDGYSYVVPSVAEAGVGYWVLVLEDVNVTVSNAVPVTGYSVELSAGWSMLGSVYDEVVDAGDVFPGYYQLLTWDGYSYVPSTTFEPEKGYWALVLEPTIITVGG